MRTIVVSLIWVLLLAACKNEKEANIAHSELNEDTSVIVYGPYRVVKLPISKGPGLANPIQLSLGPNKLLFAANQTGEIYTLHDSDGDGLEDSTAIYCDIKEFGLRSPSGFAHHGDTVFIGAAQQIRAFQDTDNDGRADKSWVFFDKIPESGHPYEWTTGLTFGPDGWLYCALATDSWNAAPSPDPNGYRGSILRISKDGRTAERMATGVRSVYGLAFNDVGDLFFTDNEGGGNQGEELNLFVKNAFYGHNPAKYPDNPVTKPAYELQTEIAPAGMVFNAWGNDFGGSGGNLFIAFYGPGERWNRGAVSRIHIQRRANGTYHYNEYPVADIPKISDLAFGSDGSLYVAQHGMADYWYNSVYENQGAFYKLIFDPGKKTYATNRNKPMEALSPNSVEAGKQLFAEYACLACHQVDGVTELLGPNLKDIGNQLSRDEILEEITRPSARIKPSMMAQQIIKKDGQVLLGRVVSSNEDELSLMLVGNTIVKVPRNDIKETLNVEKSLMYEGLLNSMAKADVEALLDYVISLSR